MATRPSAILSKCALTDKLSGWCALHLVSWPRKKEMDWPADYQTDPGNRCRVCNDRIPRIKKSDGRLWDICLTCDRHPESPRRVWKSRLAHSGQRDHFDRGCREATLARVRVRAGSAHGKHCGRPGEHPRSGWVEARDRLSRTASGYQPALDLAEVFAGDSVVVGVEAHWIESRPACGDEENLGVMTASLARPT
jgi:hypothetical protein